MDTYFAPATRARPDELNDEIAAVTHNRIVQELLNSVNGLIAVLDQYRQVVAVNDFFLAGLGGKHSCEVLGLRLGEVLGCIHCDDYPHGCGTTKYCSSCGAVIAVVSTLAEDRPVERICSLTAKRGDSVSELTLLAKASPLRIEGKRFTLLFLQDVTLEQLRAALERTFFHDIGNMLTGLLGVSQLLHQDQNSTALINVVQQSALRLYKEVEIQKCLFKNDISGFRVTMEAATAEQLLADLRNVFENHSAGSNKRLQIPPSSPPLPINTDTSLALRVMCNMVTNALEATDADGVVKIWFEQDADSLLFRVWNDKAIPEKLRCRIFQRSFTTKEGNGRGIGTYSMKLIGEKLLGGKVSFTSSAKEGTVFSFLMPNLPTGS